MNTYPLSKVYLYNTSIRPEKNAYVDDLEQYLATFQATPVEAQYQKHALKLLVKLNVAEKAQTDYSYNYCKIVNYTSANVPETAIYYFIDNISVKSPSAVELLCTMDTINTLGQGATSYGNPRNFIAETEITREHLDRFVKPSAWVPESGGYLVRFIDPESEGVVPNKVKKQGTDAVTGGDVTLKADDDYDWYIIYRNEIQVDPDHPNPPIETLLCASMPIQVGGASSAASKTFTISDFEIGKYYYFLDVDNPQGTIDSIVLGTTIKKADDIRYITGTQWAPDHFIDNKLRGLVFHRPDNNTLYYSACYENPMFITDPNGSGGFLTRRGSTDTALVELSFWGSANSDQGTTHSTDLSGVWTGIYSLQFTCTKGNLFRVSNVDYTPIMSSPEGIAALTSLEYNISVGYTSQTLNTIDAIDRTDPRIVKIIKYPYCPINYTKSGGSYQFGIDWEYDLGFLKYQKTDIPTFGNSNVVSFKNTNELLFNFLNSYATPKHSKIENAESKLFHSEFYTAKLVYDSFALPIQYEHFTWDDQEESTDFLVDFKPTSTINSKFAFKVKMPGFYKQSGDFDQYLLASRNNEETLLNSEYINYIKNGYNYDKKANALALEQANRSATTSTIGSAVSLAAGLAALLLSPATGGVSAAAGIGLISGGIMGGINTANAWTNVNKLEEQQANTMNSKLAQLQAQAASTSGTDDVDLMSWYSGNRLHFMRYEPIPQVKTALYKAFDLTGYSHHVYGTPAVDTRYWYNFIQCTPVLINEGCAPWKNEWLEDLKARYQQGVTVFHKQSELVNGVALPVWNFDQLYENWETWVINGIPAQI